VKLTWCLLVNGYKVSRVPVWHVVCSKLSLVPLVAVRKLHQILQCVCVCGGGGGGGEKGGVFGGGGLLSRAGSSPTQLVHGSMLCVQIEEEFPVSCSTCRLDALVFAAMH